MKPKMRLNLKEINIEYKQLNDQFNINQLQCDTVDLNKMLNEILPQAMSEISDPDINGKSPERFIKNLIAGKLGFYQDKIIYVGYISNKPVAILIALPIGDKPYSSYNIFSLGVYKNHRGRGIGEQLVFTLIAKLKQLSINNLYLDVHQQNTRAIKFYKDMGFEFC